MTRFLFAILSLSCCSGLYAQYSETFTGQNGKGLVDAICPAGTTNINNCGSACTANAMDNTSTCTTVPPSFSGVNWSIVLGPASTFFTDASGFGFEFGSPDDFGVVSERIQVDDPDQELCWLSPVLNIASAGAVSISVDVSQAGGLESADYVRGEYSLNGGAFVTFGTQSGNFAPTSLTVSGLSGTTLRIRVCAFTGGAGEQIYIDNISVPQAGVTTGCTPPTVTRTITQVGSCNPNSGAINVTASGGTPGYNVAWSGPSSGNPGGTEIASSGGSYNITGLSAGTYTITVTDAASCTATTTASVTTAAALSLSTQVLPADCPGAATGEIDLTVSNGVPPYTYDWSNDGAENPDNDPQDLINLVSGTYTVTVTDAANCTATASATVGTATPGAYSETFSIDGKGILDNSTCSGANGTTCTNNAFAGVNWSIYGLPDLSGIDVNDYFKTTGGNLEAKDLDGTACWESPLLDINPPGTGVAFSVGLVWNDFDREPSPDFIDVEYSLDGGAWTRVSNQVGGGTSGHTIVYASGGGGDIDGSATVNVTGLSGSTLRIRVCGNTNSESELFSIDNVSVPLAQGYQCPCPVITFTATPTNVCGTGGSNGQIVVTGVSGGTGPYMYSKDNGANFQSSNTFTGLTANTYQVVVKDATACSTTATPVVVGTSSLPTCAVSGANSVCAGSTGNVFTGTAAMSAYSWSVTGNGTAVGSTTGSAVTVTAGVSGTFTVNVTITDANGCTSTCNKVVTVNANPACSIAGATTVCANSTGNTYSAPAGMSAYSWAVTGNGTIIGAANTSTVTVTAGASGLYTMNVTVTNSNGCTSVCVQQVTVNATPTCSISGANSVCTNSTGNVYSATAGMSAYSWGISGSGSIVGSTTGSSVTVTAGGSGTYTVSVTITAANGCTSTCSQPVTINGLPSATIIGPPPSPGPSNDTLCGGHTYVFTGPPGMSAYQWNVSSNGTITGSATGSSVMITVNSNILTVLSMTVYLTVTDANGCTKTGTINKVIQPSPTCSLSGPLNVCGGSTGNVYTVTSNAQYYVWSISGNGTITSPTVGYGITSVTVTAGASGTYTVTVDTKFSFNTCMTSCSQTVTINNASTPTITGPTSVCSGGSVMLDAGAGYTTYAWSDGGGSSQTATFSNITSPTTYTVTVTAANGCTSTDTHTVAVQSCTIDFSGNIKFSNNTSLGVKDALVSLTGSATGSDLTDVNGDYFISTGLTTGSFTLKPTKTINKLNGVTVADATAVQQHVANITLITDLYKQVAADVNKSNSISTLDASIITQSLLGNPAALSQFSTSWRFVPTSHTMVSPPWGFPEQRTYTGVSGPQVNQDFYGIKTGDVAVTFANPADFGAGEPLVLHVHDRLLQAGETFAATFSAGQLNDLAAFQFALRFDPARLQLETVAPILDGLPLTADHFGLANTATGEIRAAWSQATGLRVEEAAPVFRLQFKALQSGGMLSETLQLDEEMLPAFSYNSQLAESKVVLAFDQSTEVNDPALAAGLRLQVRPNPFREETTVSFTLPAAGDVQLRVLDVNGRELLRFNNTYPAGYNSEVLRLEDLTAAGVLYCELVTEQGSVVRKMLAMK